jgi:hypothetical protein
MGVTPTSAQLGRKLGLDSLSLSTRPALEIEMCAYGWLRARNLCGDLGFMGFGARKVREGSRWREMREEVRDVEVVEIRV